jgi:putative Ig domain-containing protein
MRVIRTEIRRRALVLALAPAVPLLLMSAAPAAAAGPDTAPGIVFDGGPGTSAPPSALGPYAMTPAAADPRPVNEAVFDTVLPDGAMDFSPSVIHMTTPGGGWASWSNGYSGDVYFDPGTTLTMTLPSGTGACYFYAEPNAFSTFTVQAVAQDGTTSGPVSVNGAGGASYLGFYGTGGAQVKTITVTTDAAAEGFAVGEFGVAKRISFTSASDATVTYGSPFSFTVTTSSGGAPAITKSGQLPVGVRFTDNRDGTATLSGAPAGRSQGVYPLTFYANGGGFARQPFTLTVNRAPGLRHVGTVHAPAGTAMDQAITAAGYPAPALTESGTLPAGLAFTDHGTGTADIAGTPAAGSGGSYPVTITADNGLGTDSESFTIVVPQAPAFTSADSASASAGTPFSFTAAASGFPSPTITESGALPKGVKFAAATATFTGTPAAGTAGTYHVTLTAANSSGTVTQGFTLNIG